MRSIVPALFFISLISFGGYSQLKTYYVDNDNGGDARSGLTPAEAWKSLSKVNMTTFQPGDSILFKSGQTWYGQLMPKGSGTAAQPIVIAKYGGTARPLIDGAGVTGKAVIYLVNQSNWDITELEITNNAGSSGDRRGILIAASNGGLISRVYLKNLYVHHIKGIVGQTDAAKRTAGIGYEVLTDDNLATRFDDMLIEGCEIAYCENTGLYTDNPTGRSDYPQTPNWIKRKFTNFRIRNNRIHHIAKNAMIIRMFEKGVIEYNVCYETALQVTGNTMYTSSCDGAVFQYNEGYFNRSPDFDGSMYDADLKSPNTVWQYSYSHDNAHGLMWMWTDPADTGIIVRYNISQNDKGNLVAFRNDFRSAYVYNNVFYIDSALSPTIIMENPGQSQKYFFHNNIIYNNSPTAKYVFGAATRKIDYNVFYGKHPLSEPNDNHKLTGNPQFVNPGTGTLGIGTLDGYKLKSSSPCINTGLLVFNHSDKDFWGNAVPVGGAVERGAFEFNPNGVERGSMNVPDNFTVLQAYPNPFNPRTNIVVRLWDAGNVRLSVLDILGREVIEIYNGYLHAGETTFDWSAVTSQNAAVPSGIYLLTLRANGTARTIKMIYQK